MDLLKRELAPIIPGAWRLVDDQARQVLKLHLGARQVVDFDGPHGWELSAVNHGTLEILDEVAPGIHAGRREVRPLAELRTPIRLSIMALDSVGRGGDDPELDAVVEAAEKMAGVEDRTVFHGEESLGIPGIIPSSPHDPIVFPGDSSRYPHVVVEATEILRQAGIAGPYGLVLGPGAYDALSQAAEDGYPIRKRVDEIIEGPIVWSPAIEGGVLLSLRGGDFVLTVGQDHSIGYAWHDKDTVELYLAQSFTFRVLEPAAAVPLAHG